MNSTSTCTLSPRARALSSVLTGLVGASLTGFTSGYYVAFTVGLVCWCALPRSALVGVYQIYSISRLEMPEGGEHFFRFLDRLYRHGFRRINNEWFPEAVDRQVSFLGWMGWTYTTLYSPTIQVLWLLENWNKASAGLKIVRAIGVSVAALPSTFDTRARYGEALGRLCGRPAAWSFSVLTAASTVTLTGVAAVELGFAAKELGKSAWMVAVCALFGLLWAFLSFDIASPHDEAKFLNGLPGNVLGLGVGAFAGVFVGAPAFYVMMNAQDHPESGLSAYLRCEGIVWWQKMVAVLP